MAILLERRWEVRVLPSLAGEPEDVSALVPSGIRYRKGYSYGTDKAEEEDDLSNVSKAFQLIPSGEKRKTANRIEE